MIDVLVTAENRHKYRPVRHASSVGLLDNESYKEPQILTTEVIIVKSDHFYVAVLKFSANQWNLKMYGIPHRKGLGLYL